MPAFAAAYGTGEAGWGRRAAADEMVTMLPAFRSFIPGRKLLMVRNVAVRLLSIAARQSSSLICSTGPGRVGLPPAFATSTSTGPSSCSIWRRIASMSANLVTSAANCIARPPARSMSAVTADIAAVSRPWTTTFAPSRAKSVAIAAPMPCELPVTSATVSLRLLMLVLPLASGAPPASPFPFTAPPARSSFLLGHHGFGPRAGCPGPTVSYRSVSKVSISNYSKTMVCFARNRVRTILVAMSLQAAPGEPAGVVFPASADGRRSTSALGRAVVADALRQVDPVGAFGAEQESNWRTGYLVHFRRLVEAGLTSKKAVLAVAAEGLESLHRRMRVVPAGGTETGLDTLLSAPARRSFGTITVPGTGAAESELSLPYHGERLRGS